MKLKPVRPVLEEFEPRILYSADFAPAALAQVHLPGASDQRLLQPQQTPAAATATAEIAFVDISLPDAQKLIDDLQAQHDAGRPIEIVRIDGGEDGITRISQTLAQRSDVSAVHLLSHGSDGTLQLGSARLDAATLLARAGELAQWSTALSADADLMLYGCDVAASATGQHLLENLAALTGADVAASNDLTGAAARGGDWVLEFASGSIQAGSALSLSAQQAWSGLLLAPTNETLVNQNTNNAQATSAENRGSQQAVAFDAAGNYVVVWTSTNQDNNPGGGVYARRFTSSGTAITGEILVNATTTGDQRWARVVSDSVGNFVVTWTGSTTDGTLDNVYARRFNGAGTALTSETLVNTTSTGSQTDSVIAINASNGDYVIAWQGEGPGDSAGIFFRRFAADGTAKDSADRLANLSDGGVETGPAVTMDASGKFVIVWGLSNKLYFQRFDAAGGALGSGVQVEASLSGSSGAAVASDAAGNFTVVFRDSGSLPGVWGKGFNADGTVKYAAFQVASGDPTSPSIAMASDGTFVVPYQSSVGGPSLEVYARNYNANGTPAAAAFQVNQTSGGSQSNASAAIINANNYVIVWSGSGPSDSQGVFVRQFGAANAAPVLAAIGDQWVNEGSTFSFTASATDADLPSQTLTYSLDTASLALGMTINASTGVFSWTPTEAQGGLMPSVTLAVTDNGTGNLTDSETFTMKAVDTNVAPVLAAIGNRSVNEGATLSFTASALDADLPSQTLTYSLDAPSLALGMTINASSGAFSWTPTEIQGGLTPSVTITVADNGTDTLTDSETFTITVLDTNLAPVLAAIGNKSVNEGATLSFTASATDADLPSQNLTYSLDANSQSLGMTIGASNGVFSWTPGEERGGETRSVTITVTDNGTGSLIDSETFTITVLDTNVAPVLAAIGNKSVNEGATLNFTASALDADQPSQNLIYSLDANSQSAGMTIGASNGVFSWTPGEERGGETRSVTITVTDNGTGNLIDSETFTITVIDTNVAPVLAAIGNKSVNEGATLSFTASAADADSPGQTLTYSLDGPSLALGMTINSSTGAFSWTPTEAQGGLTPSVTITVTDNGTGTLTDSETFTVTVVDTNVAPVLAAIGNKSVNEGATLSFTASAADADSPGQTLTYSLDGPSLALGMTINSSTGAFSWTPTEAQGGLTPSVTITVTDNGTGTLTDSETFTVTVVDTNVAPVLAAIGNKSVNEGATLSFPASTTDTDVPSQTLTYSLDAPSLALGMTINSSTGVFNWTPTEDQGGLTPSVTVTVTDNGTGTLTDSETFTITVVDTNVAPVLAAIGNKSVNEGATLSFTASALDADLPSQTLSYSLDAPSMALGMAINASGVFSWTPTEDQGGLTPSVTITVTDHGTGTLTDSQTFTITVVDTNVAPVLAAIGNKSVIEGATLSFAASALDADLPSQTLTYSLDAPSMALGMAINASTGVFSWTPTEAQGGLTPPVTITVTDNGAGNLSASETFTITVVDTNVAPVLAAIGDKSVNEGATLSFTASATDADLPGQTLTYSLDAPSQALGMTINASTGVFNWTPTEAQGGLTPSVTITVTDNGTGNLSASEAFTITVNDTNVAPVLPAIGNKSVNEGATLSFTASALDADLPSQTLTYSLDAPSLALGMTINSSTGVFSWTPTEVQGGMAPSVTVTVTDNGTGNLTDSNTFTIFVGDTNLAPVLATIGNQAVSEGAALSFTASATDADSPSQTLTYSLDAASLALGMRINASTGIFNWTPSEAQGGLTPSVTVTVTDNGAGNLTDSKTFTISVLETNVAPVLAAIGNHSVLVGATLSFTASALDADLPSQTLTYSLDAPSLALGMTIDSTTGAFTWAPTGAQGSLTPSVTITVTDNGTGNLTDSETFTISVGDTNVPPVLAAIGNQSVNEGATLSFTASATDANLPSQTLAYSLDAASLALGMTIDSATGAFSWTPTLAQGGLAPSVTLTVTDNGTGNLTDRETFTITVGDLNVPPVLAVIGNQSVIEGATLSFTASATDADLPIQTLTYSLDDASLALGMTINGSSGLFSWTPTEAQGGLTPSVTLTVTDNGTGFLTAGETFTIFVGDTNLAPVLAAIGNKSVNEGATLSFTAGAADADSPSQTLTYSLDAPSLALGMTIDASIGVFGWTPTEAQGGLTPSVTITVTDNGAGNLTDSKTFTITVGDTNLAPVLAAIGNQSVNEGATLSFTASATDADLPSQTLTYSLDVPSLALGMTIDSSTGVFSWTPTEAQGGLTPSVTITVTDNGTGSLIDSESFTITVADTNIAPVLAAIGDKSVNEGATLSFTASALDADLPGQNLIYSLDAPSLALGMTIDASTGVVNWTPTEAQGGMAPSVTVSVTDNGTGNLTDGETFTIFVGDTNLAPVLATIGNQTVNEGATLSFAASATDADSPSQTLTYSLDAASLALGMTINASSGVLSWTPTEAQGGLAPSVTVTVTDNGTGNLTDSETFTIAVGDTNAAPVLAAIGNRSVNEGATLSFTAAALDADLPSQTLSYALDVPSLALGMTINASTGVFSWSPTEAQGGLAPSVTITVTDNGTANLTDSETFTITVGDTNLPPVLAAIGNHNVSEGATLSFTASASDADLPSQTVTYSLDAPSLALGMTIDASTGVFNWTPTEAQGGLAPSVTVSVTDNGTGNLTDSETFTIFVSDINVAPVLAAIGNQSVNEGATLSFTARATDADLPNQTLTYSLDAASLALGMKISASTGAFIWTPTEAQGGLTPSVTVTVTDNSTGNLTDSETFTIAVGDTNVAPVLAAIGNHSVIEGATLSFTASATDADLPSQTLTYSLDAASLALGMTIDASTGVFSWTPTEAQGGLVPSVTVSVTDNGTGNLTDSETFTITVGDTNLAPVLAAIGNQRVNEGATLSFTASAADADLPSQTLTYSLDAASLALGMTIDASTGAFGWSPTESQGGLTPSVTVTVTDDGTGNITDSETFTIFVGDTNVAPVLAAIGNQAVNEGSTPIITLTATDADLPAQTLVFSISGGADAARFTINPTTGVLSFAGAPDYESPSDANLDNVYDVTVQVSDGSLASTQAISVTVINLDDTAPVLGANRLSIVQGGSAVPVIAATDADSSSAQISFTVSGLSGGTFELAGAPGVAVTVFTQADVNAGLVRFVSDGAEAAPAYQLTPSDGVNAGVAQAATVSFTNTNDAPVITSNGGAPAATIALAENSLQVTTITATDADALDVLRFAISGGADAARFSIDAASGALRFVVAPDSEQPADANADNRYEVIVSVSDGSLQAQQSLSIDVINVNEPPTIVVNWLLLSKGGTTLVLLGTDQESAADALNYAVSGVVGGQFEYLAAPGVAITGFNQAEVNAGAVRFVVDASGASPTYSLTLSDGVSVVTAPSPGVFIEAAPPPPPVNPFPVASNPPPTQAPPSPAPVQAAKPVVAKPQALAPGPGRLSQDLLSERSDAVYEPMQARLNAATSSALAPDGLTTRDTYTTPVTNLDHFALVSEGSVDAATPGLVKLDLVSALRERLLGKELNQLHDAEQTRRHAVQNLQFAGAILVSGLSIGYVLWLARGGVLMASLMSALPAWTSVDPLPVLARSKRRDPKDDPARDDRDAESALERMFSKPGTTRTNGASNGANSAQAATSAQATGTLQAQAKAPADPRSLEEPA